MTDDNETKTPGDSSVSDERVSSPDSPMGAAEAATFADFSNETTSANGTTAKEHHNSFEDEVTLGANGDVTAVYNVPVQVSAVLGRATMPVSQLLKLGRGAVVELDRRVGESIDIFVNNRLIARGEVVVIEERLGITMTEIIKGDN